MRREIALRQLDVGNALDNEVDRRYERPLIKDA
jgi:hypothetical protein